MTRFLEYGTGLLCCVYHRTSLDWSPAPESTGRRVQFGAVSEGAGGSGGVRTPPVTRRFRRQILICGIVAQATNAEDHPMTDTDTDTNPETAESFDEQAWEEALIADLRANGGRPSQGPLKGSPDHRHVLDRSEDRQAPSLTAYDLDRRRRVHRRGNGRRLRAHAGVGSKLRSAPRGRVRVRRPDVHRPHRGHPRGRRARPPMGPARRAAAALRSRTRSRPGVSSRWPGSSNVPN